MNKIIVGTDLHKCFHEAGHIEVAYLFGATVTSAQIDTNGNGRASVVHKDLSAKASIACGGFGVEQLLFESGRLVDVAGNLLCNAAFINQAMSNARIDKFPFYLKEPQDTNGLYPNALFQPLPDNTWATESDAPFIEYTLSKIVPLLRPRMLLLEALACELLNGPITQSEIEDIRADMESTCNAGYA